MAVDLRERTKNIQVQILDLYQQGLKDGEIDPRLIKLTQLMDEAITIPGTSFRIGLDGLLGFIPVVGDMCSVFMTTWMQQEAKRLGLPRHRVWQMWFNSGVDFAIGMIPFAGDLFDFAWKANRKNLRILQNHVEKMKRKQMMEGTVEVREQVAHPWQG